MKINRRLAPLWCAVLMLLAGCLARPAVAVEPFTVTIADPAPGSTVTSLSQVTGTAVKNTGSNPPSGILSTVSVTVRRLADNLFWSGARWDAGQQSRPATVNAPNWSCATSLLDTDIPDGSYQLTATACDSNSVCSSANTQITVERTEPVELNYSNVAMGQALSSLPQLLGTVLLPNLTDLNLTIRRPDAQFWTGTAWQPQDFFIPIAFNGSLWSYPNVPTGSNLVEGIYEITITARDSSNVRTEVTVYVQVDLTPPDELVFETPPPGTILQQLTAVNGTVADNAGGSGLRTVFINLLRNDNGAYWNGMSWGTPGEVVTLQATLTGNDWQLATALPGGADLPDGLYTLQGRAIDRAGNFSQDALLNTFQVDNTPPVAPTIDSPADGTIVPGLSPLKGTAFDLNGIADVSFTIFRFDDLYWNGSAWTTTATTLHATLTPTLNGVDWAYNGALPQSETDLLNGEYIILASATDNIGNVSGPRGSTVTVHAADSTKPLVAITAPLNNATPATFPAITGSTSDNRSGVKQINLTITRQSDGKIWDGAAWTAPPEEGAAPFVAVIPSGGNWSYSLPAGAGQPAGAFNIVAVAEDNAGNLSIAASVNIAIPSPLSVAITAPAEGATRIDFSGIAGTVGNTGSAALNGVRIELRRLADNMIWTGTAWAAGTGTVPAMVSGSGWTLPTGIPTGAALTNGQYRITAYASDAVGHEASAAIGITINQGISISGIVTDENGQGRAGFPVQRLDTGGGVLESIFTGTNGVYTFVHVQPGNYVIRPQLAGYGFNPASQDVTAGDTDVADINFGRLPKPSITSFSPSSGPVGAEVTITGVNVVNDQTVKPTITFNGVAVAAGNVTVTEDLIIVAKVPPGATTGPIGLTTSAGSAVTTVNFTVVAAPTITGFSPGSGVAGAAVTITGTNFTNVTTTKPVVKFNATTVPAADVTVVSTGELQVKIPAGATTGKIAVQTSGGTAISATNFTVVTPPTITGFSPATGPVGTTVFITGANLTGTSAVTFGGVAVTAFTVNALGTQITTTVPAGSLKGKIQVTTPSGTIASATDFTTQYPPPTVSSFSPVSGPTATMVTLTGTNFVGATAVKFNGTAATFTVVNTTTIAVAVPAGATNGPISVTTPNGTAGSSTEFFITAPPTVAPKIASFNPQSGKAGTPITITGTNFVGITGVKFKGLAAFFTTLSATQIRAIVPAGAASGVITVTNAAGTATSATNFTLLQLPLITTFAPISGPVGTEVTITGKNFSGATIVRFNNKATTGVTVISATQVKAKLPVGTVTGPIAVTTAVGASADTGKFQVLAPPNITTFSPASGKVGAEITINGSDFTGLRELKFFNNKQPVIVSVTDTKIVAKVPTGAVTGPIFIRTGLGSMSTKGSFFVIPGTPPRSTGATLSGAAASSLTQTVTLTFSAPLDAESAVDAAHYMVTVNGAVVALESAAYNAAARRVTLGVAGLLPGSGVTVAWADLTDAKGALIDGRTPVMMLP